MAVVALLLSVGTVGAADAPLPPPLVKIHADIMSGQYDTKATSLPLAGASASGAKAATAGRGAVTRGGSLNSTVTSQTWYDITIANNGDFAAANLTVNYVVYTKSTTSSANASGQNSSGITMQENPGSYTIARIDPAKKDIAKTSPLTLSMATNTNSSRGPSTIFRSNRSGSFSAVGVKGPTISSTGTTVTNIAGIYVEVMFNGKIIQTLESPDRIRENYKSLSHP